MLPRMASPARRSAGSISEDESRVSRTGDTWRQAQRSFLFYTAGLSRRTLPELSRLVDHLRRAVIWCIGPAETLENRTTGQRNPTGPDRIIRRFSHKEK